jgi:starch phosphorylase
MKVLVNGGLNLSELDGWWAEAFTSGVGWSLGDGRVHDDTVEWDRAEARQLFNVLEDEVIPCFYRRDERWLPREWIDRVRESMACLTTKFSSNRMLREYVEKYYVPMAENYRRRTAGTAVELQEWYRKLVQHWQRIHFGEVRSTEAESGYRFEVQVYLDDLPPEAVCVELYADPGEDGKPFCQPLQRGAMLAGAANAYAYQGTAPAARPIQDYTPRIVPAHDDALVPPEAGFILWFR